MNTYLGACVTFGEADVDEDLVAAASVTYLEGYLFDPPAAQAAFRKAAAAAHRAGQQVALSLSDAFCVDRHRAAFRDLVSGHVDILFANETEITSLYEKNSFAEAAGSGARADVGLAALTKSEAGSVILQCGSETVTVAAEASARRGYDRGGRRLRGGVPGGLDGGAAARRVRPHGQPGGGGGHQPLWREAGSGFEIGGKARVGVARSGVWPWTFQSR